MTINSQDVLIFICIYFKTGFMHFRHHLEWIFVNTRGSTHCFRKFNSDQDDLISHSRARSDVIADVSSQVFVSWLIYEEKTQKI